jgi:hypothetical protein
VVVLELGVQLRQVHRCAVQPSPGQDVSERRLRGLGSRARVLGHVAERALFQDQPGSRVVLARQHFEQARLAGAVASDQTDLVPRRHGEARVREHPARDDVDGEISDLQHDGECYVPPDAAFGQTARKFTWEAVE